MINRKFFGYDKYFKSIFENSIIKFVENGKNKIGHLWLYNDKEWIISYNHLYSECGRELGGRPIRSLRLVGNGEDYEFLLEQ